MAPDPRPRRTTEEILLVLALLGCQPECPAVDKTITAFSCTEGDFLDPPLCKVRFADNTYAKLYGPLLTGETIKIRDCP